MPKWLNEINAAHRLVAQCLDNRTFRRFDALPMHVQDRYCEKLILAAHTAADRIRRDLRDDERF